MILTNDGYMDRQEIDELLKWRDNLISILDDCPGRCSHEHCTPVDVLMDKITDIVKEYRKQSPH